MTHDRDEDAIRAILDSMADDAERKQWLIEQYADGEMDAEEIAFWFYVYELREA